MTNPFYRLIILALSIVLAGCNIALPDPNRTPTPEILISDTPTAEASPTAEPSVTPSITPTQEIIDVPVVVSSPLPTQPQNPVVVAVPTETPAPCPVTILDTDAGLTQALLRVPCGNQVTLGLVAAVVAFNDNLTNADFVSPGLELLVPPPSPTPIPEGAPMTETAAAGLGVVSIGSAGFPVGTSFGEYVVQEGDSILGIADLFNSTLEQMSILNQDIPWTGCNFTNPSGGPSCSPQIRIGQALTVPLPTGTPVPTNTPSGNETATPLPTFPPARAVSPPEGALVGAGQLRLQWVGVTGLLGMNEAYLIEVADRTAGTTENFTTRSNAFALPQRLIPTDGQAHEIEWRVSVARENPDGSYTPIGGIGAWNRFTWNSR